MSKRALSSLQVDLAALRFNLESIKNSAKKELIFMVKADAYGHGAWEVVSEIMKTGLTKNFGLASVEELRGLPKDPSIVYWIFSELDLKNNRKLFSQANLVPVLSNQADLEFYLDYIGRDKFALKFNTGMNRLGFDDIEAVLKALSSREVKSVKHVMTHFSSSAKAIAPGDKTSKQQERFNVIKNAFQKANISIEGSSSANSGAIERAADSNDSHIRPGLLAYGIPSEELASHIEVKQVGFLQSEILTLAPYPAGTEIGYGDTKLPQAGWIAYVPLGYGDGILNAYCGAKLRCGELVGTIFGRVSMDLLAVYFSKRPTEREIHLSDSCFKAFREVSGMIPYEVLTTISARVPRIYKY